MLINVSSFSIQDIFEFLYSAGFARRERFEAQMSVVGRESPVAQGWVPGSFELRLGDGVQHTRRRAVWSEGFVGVGLDVEDVS